MKKSAGRKERRKLARANKRAEGRKKSRYNEWLQKRGVKK